MVGLDTVNVVVDVVEDFDVVGTSTTADMDVDVEVVVIVVGFVNVVAISIMDKLFDMVIVLILATIVEVLMSMSVIDPVAIGSISAQTLPASKANAVRDIGKCIAVM
ncbi:hypothetical protein MMC30_004351 [Trapelia coarctata]|nr:hypothetical protein [Trapelia coarctata]